MMASTRLHVLLVVAFALTFVIPVPSHEIAPAIAGSQLPSDVPLPGDLAVVPPGPDVPSKHAAFSGVWSGQWQQTLNHVLVVERVEKSSAVVVYAWGKAPRWDIYNPGWDRLQAHD